MTQNKRIILNIATTYGRSIIGVLCGIFSMRWVLMALGHENFGLYGVVGSMVIFVSFLNIQFSGALSRYYAYSIGQLKVAEDKDAAIEECRCWFTTGVMIHSLLPILLVGIGYPIGSMVIQNGWLSIPKEKIDVCVWLWRFAMLSCFVGMVNVPFQAMYTAKQYIVELTIYSIVQVLVRTLFVYYMTTISKDWLLGYGFAMCLISITPALIICLRALLLFPECRFCRSAFESLIRIRELAVYVWWQIFNGLGYLARHQWLEIVVNKFFGPRVNAAYTVGVTLGAEASALTGALNNAFIPAVTTVYGMGDHEQMRALAYRACKFGTLMTLIFAIPMALEINEILFLWLKNPPKYATTFCLIWLLVMVFEKFSLGHLHAVLATGKTAMFLFSRGCACLFTIPLSVILVLINSDVMMIGLALIVTTILMVVSDVITSRRITGLSIRYWVIKILLPLLLVFCISIAAGYVSVWFFPKSLSRIVITTCFVEMALLPFSWLWVLDQSERQFVLSRVCHYCGRFKRSFMRCQTN